MGHGSPGTPTVTSSGTGQYQVGNVVFQMAGEWELRGYDFGHHPGQRRPPVQH